MSSLLPQDNVSIVRALLDTKALVDSLEWRSALCYCVIPSVPTGIPLRVLISVLSSATNAHTRLCLASVHKLPFSQAHSGSWHLLSFYQDWPSFLCLQISLNCMFSRCLLPRTQLERGQDMGLISGTLILVSTLPFHLLLPRNTFESLFGGERGADHEHLLFDTSGPLSLGFWDSKLTVDICCATPSQSK